MPPESSNGHVEAAAVFPPLSKAFKGLLKLGSTYAAALPRPERLQVKLCVEAIAAQMGCKVRDVVLHYELGLDGYFNHADPLTSGDPPPKRRTGASDRRQLRHASLAGYSAADKLALLEEVETRMRDNQVILAIAREATGMHTKQYYRLDAERVALRAQVAAEESARQQASSEAHPAPLTPPVSLATEGGRFEVADEDRPIVVDAANVLSVVSRDSIQRAAALLGVRYAEIQDWKQETGREWLYPMQGRKRELPLPRDILMLSTADKLRALAAFAYLERPLRQSRYQLAATLGYREETVRQWAAIRQALERHKARKAAHEEGIVLSYAEVQEICAATGETQPGLQTWIKAAGLKDAYMQVVLRGHITPGETLEPDQLMDLWEAQWSGAIEPQQLDTPVRYYLPAADYFAVQAVNRTHGTLDPDVARSYARVGMLDVVRKYDLKKNTKFLTYASIRVTGEIWDGVRHDDNASRLARSWDKKLSEAESRWSMENGRKPKDDELAAELGITLEKLSDVRFTLFSTQQASLHEVLGDDGEHRTRSRLDYAADTSAALPTEIVGEVFDALMIGLGATQQRLLIAYYKEGKTMREIGLELDLSESRVSQMHSELLGLLEDRIISHEGHEDILGIVYQRFATEAAA